MKPVVFPLDVYGTVYKPESQMVLIVLNLKKKTDFTMFDGETDIGVNEVIHPKLKEIGGEMVPTIKHGKTILAGATDCIEYIDKTFGVKKDILYPRDPNLQNETLYCQFFIEVTFK